MDTTKLGFTFDLAQGKSSIIKVIGVGGGGGNAVAHMFNKGIDGVDFIVCNTDGQALQNSPVGNKIQLGATTTEGLGAGADPEVGEKAALESIDELKAALGNNTKMLFITAGMGGGTGTGAAPVVAKIAKEMGILTVAIVTVPFQLEGRRRLEQAELGLEKLKANVDSIIVINNDKLFELYPDLGFKSAFAKADEVLSDAAKGMAELITGFFDVNVDFRDAKSVLQDSGTALMSIGVGTGENRAQDAINKALDSPLLNDNKIKGSKKILLLLRGGKEEVKLKEHQLIMEHVTMKANSGVGNKVDVIFGIGTDEALGESLSVLVIATGFTNDKEIQLGAPERVVHHLDGNHNTIISTQSHVKDLPEEELPTQKTIFSLEDIPTKDHFEFPLDHAKPDFPTSHPQFPTSTKNTDELSENQPRAPKSDDYSFPLENKLNPQTLTGTLFAFDDYENAEEQKPNEVRFTLFEKIDPTPMEVFALDTFEDDFTPANPMAFVFENREEIYAKPQEVNEVFKSTEPVAEPKELAVAEQVIVEQIEGFKIMSQPKPEASQLIMQRREKLKEFNSRYKKTDEHYDFENIPAYIRQNKNLEMNQFSTQETKSFFTDDSGRTEMKENKFLNRDAD